MNGAPPPPPRRTAPRQKIRPSWAELGASAHGGGGDDNDGFVADDFVGEDPMTTMPDVQWRPAATVVRASASPNVAKTSSKVMRQTVPAGAAPTSSTSARQSAPSGSTIPSSASPSTGPKSKKTVRIVAPERLSDDDDDAEAQGVRGSGRPADTGEELPTLPERFRFALDDEQPQEQGVATANPSFPIIGSVSERHGGVSRGDRQSTTAAKGKASRFAAKKSAAAQGVGAAASSVAPGSSSSSRGFPDVAHRSAASDVATTQRGQGDTDVQSSPAGFPARSEAEEVEWLDENGEIMSAFRRAMLQKQGREPPAKRPLHPKPTKSVAVAEATAGGPIAPGDDARDSIGDDNARRVAAMTPAEVETELEELRQFLGADLFEAFKSRARQKAAASEGGPAAETSTPDAPKTSSGIPVKLRSDSRPHAGTAKREQDPHQATPDQIRRSFFPMEPPESDANVAWMLEAPANDADDDTAALRFHFDGRLLSRVDGDDERTRIEGLHHHGSDQDRPGYTPRELLRLARSTVAAQRVMALQTLARVLERYPQRLDGGGPNDSAATLPTSRELEAKFVRAETALVAGLLLNDRQLSVRRAAVHALASAVKSTAAGIPAILEAAHELPLREPPMRPDSGRMGRNAALDEVRRDVRQGLVRVGLVPALAKLVGDDPETASACAASISDVLLCITACSKECATSVADSKVLVDFIVDTCLRRPWPPADDPSQLPILSAFGILRNVVASSRRGAQTVLMATSAQEALHRYVAVPPWRLGGVKTGGGRLQSTAWAAFGHAVEVHRQWACYGLNTSFVSTSWDLLRPVLDWLSRDDLHSSSEDELESSATQSSLQMLEAFTVCAADPHELEEPHGVTWSQVRDWLSAPLGVLRRRGNESIDGAYSTAALRTTAAALRHIAAWCRAAVRLEAKTLSDASGELSSVRQALRTVRPTLKVRLGDAVRMTPSGPHASQATFRRLEHVEALFDAGSAIIDLGRSLGDEELNEHIELVEVARLVISSPLLKLYLVPSMLCRGTRAMRRRIMRFVSQCAELSSAGPPDLDLALLARLDPADAELALPSLRRVLARAKVEDVLLPFMAENVRVDAQPSPLVPVEGSLRRVATLYSDAPTRARPSTGPEDPNTASEEEGVTPADDTDPISRAKLWKSPASGLPLRRDWPMLALDDLLRSAECAALNRPNALPSGWDANERDIVAATLRLGVKVVSRMLDAGLAGVLPSASELLLAAIKVFLLEAETAGDSVASGAATGKELFRDAAIWASLGESVSLASRLACHAESRKAAANAERVHDDDGDGEDSDIEDNLERATARTLGEKRPFYQLYTDLVGVYDAISFGDENFGAVLVAPLAQRYAPDYRRLLWCDYAHVLRSVRVGFRGAPLERVRAERRDATDEVVDLGEYLEPAEEDEAMVSHYLAALGARSVTVEGQPLLYRIAVHHVAANLWSVAATDDARLPAPAEERDGVGSPRREGRARRLASAVFSRRRDGAPPLPEEVVAALVRHDVRVTTATAAAAGATVNVDAPPNVVEERLAWLARVSGAAAPASRDGAHEDLVASAREALRRVGGFAKADA